MNLIRNQWYGAIWSDHLADKPVARRILNKPLVLFRGEDGAAAALDDSCPHRFAPLSMGALKDGVLRCPYHGLEFNQHGACVHNPHTNGRIPPAAKVKSYPVIERHGMAWIWMGEKAPDPSHIPDLSILDGSDPKLTSDPGYIQIEANYSLIIENLLDASHAGVLHDGVLGNIECLRAEPKVTEAENGDLIVSRDMFNIPAAEMLDLMYKADGQELDHWLDARLIGVSCVVNTLGINDAGAGRGGGTGMYGIHILTPMDERTTHYHFGGVRINPPERTEADDMMIRQRVLELRTMAFSEQDGPMISAQQRVLDDPYADTSRPALFEIDVAAARFHRRIRQLMEAEAGSQQG